MEFYHEHSPSFRHKLKSSICSPCGLMNHHHDELDPDHSDRPRLIRCPSAMKEKCINLLSRIGKSRRGNNAAEFRYDPLSYALNFDDDTRIDEFPLRNFSARLPPSPPPPGKRSPATKPIVLSREIAAWC
ncbi:hypothetical protein Nepgr_014315 [Nepenthes gracilis]|uniref:Uncharacterized protein n=1 Tax=Nepenthes gracilis TaxID=150966 RepID=A0AAD3SKP5_NEPGR|nr:hypothetical protein Nepgr_014315 [Nepenthes gracilis]